MHVRVSQCFITDFVVPVRFLVALSYPTDVVSSDDDNENELDALLEHFHVHKCQAGAQESRAAPAVRGFDAKSTEEDEDAKEAEDEDELEDGVLDDADEEVEEPDTKSRDHSQSAGCSCSCKVASVRRPEARRSRFAPPVGSRDFFPYTSATHMMLHTWFNAFGISRACLDTLNSIFRCPDFSVQDAAEWTERRLSRWEEKTIAIPEIRTSGSGSVHISLEDILRDFLSNPVGDLHN